MHLNEYDNFGASYFEHRQGNDPLRQKTFIQEKEYLVKWVGSDVFEVGNLLDVGCSTGEFIKAIKWNIKGAYGIEVSEFAANIAATQGIKFNKSLSNSESFFDLIVFRGTIQYLKEPFSAIEQSFKCLKPGGFIVFLATPNSNSIYYRKFGTLPFLEERLNFLIPSDTSISMNLKNAGFRICDISYPYLRSIYSKPILDHLKFLQKIVFRTDVKFPFWRSSMNIVAVKM